MDLLRDEHVDPTRRRQVGFSTAATGLVGSIHLKFMLVDRVSDDPLVITGLANWSDESPV